nr:hypothetical protein CFP56_22430 [Quercus suber]
MRLAVRTDAASEPHRKMTACLLACRTMGVGVAATVWHEHDVHGRKRGRSAASKDPNLRGAYVAMQSEVVSAACCGQIRAVQPHPLTRRSDVSR